MRHFAYCLALVASLILFCRAADAQCGKTVPACSYTAINGNCSVTINRMNPVTPPTIYVKPSCSVTVIVPATTGYKLETLTLDWKSGTATVPTDVFSTVFAGVSPSLGKLTVVTASSHLLGTTCENVPTLCGDARTVYEAQKRVMDAVATNDPVAKAKDTLADIKLALSTPPVPLPQAVAGKAQPWTDPDNWKINTVNALNTAVPDDATLATLRHQRINIDDDVKRVTTDAANALTNAMAAEKAADLAVSRNAPNANQQKQAAEDALNAAYMATQDVQDVAANETILDSAVDELTTATKKIQALSASISGIELSTGTIVGNNQITDPQPRDRNYQTQVWTLDYVNLLQPAAKQAAANALTDNSAALLGGLSDPSPKQPILSITVQFQNPLPVEASAGLMVPFMPYHSYAKSTDASGNPIASETTSYALVPIALVNAPVAQWIAHQQPAALFVSGGVGVNSVTSAVEFGVGLGISFRSIEVSFLADVGRDQQLTGGITPNGPLGSYGAPPTQNVWQVRPAAALSVRIPLGGGGGSSSGH